MKPTPERDDCHLVNQTRASDAASSDYEQVTTVCTHIIMWQKFRLAPYHCMQRWCWRADNRAHPTGVLQPQ